ncbi:lipid droplet-associated protein [Gordonia sp. ABSL1-1]|uniref:lipid droplet-associated protein n=1 Tax=Gordonia sp. ABSL1-1 TaxID=3053923 RepID=UPI002573466E|nr:lipid droplet-associated protein [Gordonia sp. ABSL1-1]MDL9938337.1 lipid droplet-associated protein [Gordonia sp. ABSL1-1]
MVRAPYPARIAAGLIVTAIEETKKLPALIVTLPMTAVSQTLQAGMRAQQNIAELAIKGDAVLESIFDKPDEQPAWARFDEDEDTSELHAAIATPIEITQTDESAPARAAAKPAKKAAAKKTAPKPAAVDPATDDATEPAAGRFALYSSAPEDVVTAAETGAPRPAVDGQTPEVVEYLEYDGLTLAQLRAKLRTVGADDLAALAEYEKDNRNRSPFVTMLDNRIAAQNKRPSTT